MGVTGCTTQPLTLNLALLTMANGRHHKGMVMAERVRCVSRTLGLFLGAAALASCGAMAVPSTAPAHVTATAACLDSLGGGWQVAVETDRPDSAMLALVSGDSIATCQTWVSRTATAWFGATTTAVGKHPVSSPPALSYVTGGGTTAGEPSFLVGRVPPATVAVRLTFGDGTQQSAVLGSGLWLAWLQQPSEPTVIEALDASGAVVARLADANGLQPTD